MWLRQKISVYQTKMELSHLKRIHHWLHLKKSQLKSKIHRKKCQPQTKMRRPNLKTWRPNPKTCKLPPRTHPLQKMWVLHQRMQLVPQPKTLHHHKYKQLNLRQAQKTTHPHKPPPKTPLRSQCLLKTWQIQAKWSKTDLRLWSCLWAWPLRRLERTWTCSRSRDRSLWLRQMSRFCYSLLAIIHGLLLLLVWDQCLCAAFSRNLSQIVQRKADCKSTGSLRWKSMNISNRCKLRPKRKRRKLRLKSQSIMKYQPKKWKLWSIASRKKALIKWRVVTECSK